MYTIEKSLNFLGLASNSSLLSAEKLKCKHGQDASKPNMPKMLFGRDLSWLKHMYMITMLW